MKNKLVFCLMLLFTFNTANAEDKNFIHEYLGCSLKFENNCSETNRQKYCQKYDGFPDDARDYINLSEHCNFLGGELNGTESDAGIFELSEELGCGKYDVKKLQERYKSEPEIIANLDSFLQNFEAEKRTCISLKKPY